MDLSLQAMIFKLKTNLELGTLLKKMLSADELLLWCIATLQFPF